MTITSSRSKFESICPATTAEVQLYVIPSATEIDGLLRVCNLTSTAATYRVAHCDAGHGNVAANDQDFIAYDVSIAANKTHEYSIHAIATETIRVRTGTADALTFHLSGNKKVTS